MKAKVTKVKIFTASISMTNRNSLDPEFLENAINNWLESNADIELVAIKYSAVNAEGTALIIYKAKS